VEHSLDVLELCRSLADEGHAVVIATHDLNGACRFADTIALMDAGRLVGVGPPASVVTPESLERAFHVRSEVESSSDGTPFLVFHRLSNVVRNLKGAQKNVSIT